MPSSAVPTTFGSMWPAGERCRSAIGLILDWRRSAVVSVVFGLTSAHPRSGPAAVPRLRAGSGLRPTRYQVDVVHRVAGLAQLLARGEDLPARPLKNGLPFRPTDYPRDLGTARRATRRIMTDEAAIRAAIGKSGA